jgi:uncharacterized membrane protein
MKNVRRVFVDGSAYAGAETQGASPLSLASTPTAARTAVVAPPSSRTCGAAAVVLVLALAVALRAWGLVRQSAWADEITTLSIADPSRPFGQFWNLLLSDVHPPLYYLLMRWWFAALGQSDLVARLPSIIFGVLAVGAAALAFKPYRFRARLPLMVFLAVSPGAIEYAQEARSYSLLLLLSTIVTGACYQFVRRHRDDGRGATRAILLLALAGIIASYTHYFGFLIAVAAGVTALVAARGDARRCGIAGLGLATVLAAFLPWVIYHAHYMSNGVKASAWIADFPVDAMIWWFLRLSFGGTPALLSAAAIATICVLMPRFRACALRDAACRVAVSVPLLVLAGALAVSCYTPVLTSRNLIVVLPALYLALSFLVDFGVMRWGTPVTAACLAAQLLLMMRPLPSYYTLNTKEQWRESAALVLAQPGCVAGPIYVYGDIANYRYLTEKERPHLELIEIPIGGVVPPLRPSTDCNVLVWAADLPRSEFDALLSRLPMDRPCERVAAFYWAFVALRDPSGACEIWAAPLPTPLGHELGVRHVLEGSWQSDAGRIPYYCNSSCAFFAVLRTPLR